MSTVMRFENVAQRYRQLQQLIDWNEEDARRVQAVFGRGGIISSELIEDLGSALQDESVGRGVQARAPCVVGGTPRREGEVSAEPSAATGLAGVSPSRPLGHAQVPATKPQTAAWQAGLRGWLSGLGCGSCDGSYAWDRWNRGAGLLDSGMQLIHVRAGLARLRGALFRAVADGWAGEVRQLLRTVESLNRLLDLESALVEDVYGEEGPQRQHSEQPLANVEHVVDAVAQELRNPLNVVKTSVYYLLHAHHPSAEKTAEHLQRIERQIRLANRVLVALSKGSGSAPGSGAGS